MEFTIDHPQSRDELEVYFDLRWRVLREPWDQPRGSERDEFEEEAFHLGAYLVNCDNGCAGCSCIGRLSAVACLHFNSLEEAKIRQVAVLDKYRGKGAGSLLVSGLEEIALSNGAKRIVLTARETAVKFYEKNGYHVTGQGKTLFDIIPQYDMRKDL